MVLPQMDPYPSLASNASVGLCFSSYKQLSHCESRYCMENKCYESHNECPHHTDKTQCEWYYVYKHGHKTGFGLLAR